MSATPAKLYESRLLALATAVGPPRERYPLPSSCPIQFSAYAFDQEFEMLLWKPDGTKLFPPAQKNTPSNATIGGNLAFAGLLDENAILTKLSQPSPTYGGKGRFTGSFARVPASWDRIDQQTITFPGIRDVAYIGGVRDPKPWTVNIRVRTDYFVVDPAGLATGVIDSGSTAIARVTNHTAIPNILHTPFGFTIDGGTTMLTTGEVTSLVKAGGITGWYETVPKTETYQAWIAVAKAFNTALFGGSPVPWDATHPPLWDGLNAPATTIGQWCYQDSRVTNYEGSIFQRESYYVMAM